MDISNSHLRVFFSHFCELLDTDILQHIQLFRVIIFLQQDTATGIYGLGCGNDEDTK